MQKTKEMEQLERKNSVIYDCNDELTTHEIGVTNDPQQKFKEIINSENRTIDFAAMIGVSFRIAEMAAIDAFEPCQPNEIILGRRKNR